MVVNAHASTIRHRAKPALWPVLAALLAAASGCDTKASGEERSTGASRAADGGLLGDASADVVPGDVTRDPVEPEPIIVPTLDAGAANDAGGGAGGTGGASPDASAPDATGPATPDAGPLGGQCPAETCSPGGVCVSDQDGYHCECDAGYTGTGTQSCTPVAASGQCDAPFRVATMAGASGPVWYGNGADTGIVLWQLPRTGSTGWGYAYALYRATTGFEPAVRWVETAAANPAAAVDAAGNVLLAWELIGATRELWADYYDASAGAWRGATNLGSKLGADNHVAFAPDGTGMILYIGPSQGFVLPMVRSYLPAGPTWTAERTLASVTNQDAQMRSIEVAQNVDELIVGWIQAPTSGQSPILWTNHYRAGDWLPTPLETGDATTSGSFALAANDGHAAVAYNADNTADERRLYARRYERATGWAQDRELVYAGVDSMREIQLAVEGSGLLHVVWQRVVLPGRVWHVYWSAAAAGGAWPDTVPIGLGAPSGAENDMLIAPDPLDDMRLCFNQSQEHRSNRYDAQSGSWGASSAVERVDEHDAGPANGVALGNLGPSSWITLWVQSYTGGQDQEVWAALCN